MFKIIALVGAIAGGATYGLYAHTDLFGYKCDGSRCALVAKLPCCEGDGPTVYSPPCCDKPCAACADGCDGCPLCEIDCSACCTAVATAISTGAVNAKPDCCSLKASCCEAKPALSSANAAVAGSAAVVAGIVKN